MKQRRHKGYKRIGIVAVAAMFLCIVGCRQLPEIVAGRGKTGKDFMIEYRGDVSVTHIEIWSSTKQVYLWSWKVGEENSFDYGILPDTAKQVFPVAVRPPSAVSEGEEIVVSVNYFYDTALPPSACAGSDTKAFKWVSDKFVSVPLTRRRVPKWKSDKERQDYVRGIENEIESSNPLFLKVASDPNATEAQKNMIAALKRCVGLDDPKEAYIELRSIDAFCPYSAGLSDLSVLKDFTNITTLAIPHNSVSDIGPLSNLSQLTFLRLEDNKIIDLSPLRDLRHLSDLRINGNSVSSLAPLSGLTDLHRLQASENHITDVKPLSPLENLSDLDLSGNQIADIAPLKGLQNLFELNLSNNKIAKIGPLAEIRKNNITGSDVPIRTTIRTYGRLNLSGNPIVDEALLENFQKSKVDLTE